MMKDMAEQWRETGSVSGRVYWPGGGVEFGSIEWRWQLPEDAESEGISAKVAAGVLTITVPKKQPQPEPQDEQQDIFIA